MVPQIACYHRVDAGHMCRQWLDPHNVAPVVLRRLLEVIHRGLTSVLRKLNQFRIENGGKEMKAFLPLLALLLGFSLTLHAQPQDTLDIYWIDVEGGAATLIVTPEGETILMDAGYARDDERDAIRIHAALEDARASRIDYFITSHFHGDHVGGVPALAKRVPIGRFLDHGDSVEQDSERGGPVWEAYVQVATGKRRTVKPGDKLSLTGVQFNFVASASQFIPEPLEPQGPNSFCRDAELKQDDPGENGKSVGFLVSLGAFQFLDLGDLTWNFEHELACPQNRLGVVDLYQVTHHGLASSGAPQLVWAVKPTVAVMNNGPRKGGNPSAYEVLDNSPGIEGIWQVHRSLAADPQHNTDERMIANLTEESDCRGHWIKAMIDPDGRSYTITNGRNGFSRTYMSK